MKQVQILFSFARIVVNLCLLLKRQFTSVEPFSVLVDRLLLKLGHTGVRKQS